MHGGLEVVKQLAEVGLRSKSRFVVSKQLEIKCIIHTRFIMQK